MQKNLVAKATTSIKATRPRVWHALVSPEAIKQYMFGADVESDWREGSPIIWKGEMKGKSYRDKGVILKLDPDRTLQYSHFSPSSGKPDRPENYHTVTIDLSGAGTKTEVSLSQDNNADEKSCRESEKNWEAMLDGLKKCVESEVQAGGGRG
ncbi:MAG TPA: SRPBCC domain-containing protein [Casimicrobiaceae bacterium]|nr:SRPBCC domain-containing protein [Casimicrobiaceae bacterium]